MAGNWEKRTGKAMLMAALGASLLVAGVFAQFSTTPMALASDRNSDEAKQAFFDASEVLFSPRCINCHPSGDAPTIHDDSLPHRFNVRRGPEGKGVGGLICIRCHKDTNQPDGRPGAPNWHMPPEQTPMTFRNRTAGELCRQLKDPKLNGGRTGEQIIDHLNQDPLVLWSWNPGAGRTPPKMDHKTFTEKMQEWLKKGGACPD